MSAEQHKENKPVVLLATQSPLSAKSIHKLLQAQFTLLEVNSSEDSWDVLTNNSSINLLMTDLSLLDDQFGLLERIKTAQNKNIRDLPVLLLIAENDYDDDREDALNNGATDFLTMPFSSSELIARVRMHTHLFVKQEKSLNIDKDDSIDILQQLTSEAFLESRLKQELSFSARHKIPVTACKVSVDKLDDIEQKYGHKLAHKIIKSFAKILQSTIRLEDVLSYSGHGTFTILYPATNAIGGLTAIKRIKSSTNKSRVTLGDNSQTITFSASVYTSFASESVDVDSIQNELKARLSEALIKGNGSIIAAGHNDKNTISCKPTIPHALALIEKNNTDDLKDHSKALMTDIIPLLRFSDQQLNLGMDKVIKSLIQRLKKR